MITRDGHVITFDGATDGWRVVRFIEKFCRITRGRQAGQHVVLRPWQIELILEIFRLDDMGWRSYRTGLLGIPRKNGKSMLGACLALYFLIADGEIGAEVYSCAGDKKQASIVFAEAKRMVELEPLLANRLEVTRDEIKDARTNSVYRVLSAEAFTKEGLNPSAVIFDEVHVQPNHELWDVMTLGSGTRERALCLGITTAGYDKDTLCGELYTDGMDGAVYRDGAWRSRHDSFFFVWYQPEKDDCDWRDPEIRRSCNPALGDFLLERAVLAEMRNGESAVRRYRLNQWTAAITLWLPYGRWSELAVPDRRIVLGEACVFGFDGSFSGDSTALVAVTRGGFVQTLEVWERPQGSDGDGWRVDIDTVEKAIEAKAKALNPYEIAADPYRWQRSLQALEALGLPMVEFPQSPARMITATARFYDAVMDDGHHLTHDGDPRLARHIANARVNTTDPKGPRIVKETKMSARKIDAAVAAVMAFDRAGQPEEEDTSPSIF